MSSISTHAQMPWDPFIIECMEGGKNRAECFDALPPDLLLELEAYEAKQRELRRAQMALRESLSHQDRVFGQAAVGDSQAGNPHGQTPSKPHHTASVLPQPMRFEVALPTSVEEPFLLQLFEVVDTDNGDVIRMMRATSEVTDAAIGGTIIPITRPFGDAFHLHADQLRERYYVRLILTRSLTYRDYKPTLARFRADGTIHLEGYVESDVDFSSYATDTERPINRR